MNVPYSWTVYVQLRMSDGSIPTNQQISQIRAFESYNSTMQDLCGAGLEADGKCTLHFGRERFYPPRTNPTLTIKVYDCKGALLHSQAFSNVVNNSTLSVKIGGSDVENWQVSGTVKNSTNVPLTSGSVRAFDTYYTPERLLGSDSLGRTGKYKINYTSETFGKTAGHSAPKMVVRVFNTENIAVAEETRTSPSQNETVNIVVAEASEEWQISGKVLLNSVPLISGTVHVYDKFGGFEYIMGSAKLNASGNYLVKYLKSQFQHGNPRPYPDLIVKVYDKSSNLLGESSVSYPPSNNQPFDIAIEKPVPEKWQISGKVKRSDESLIEKGIVHIYDVYKDYEYILGTCALGVTGTYLVNYNSSQFQHELTVRPSPDLRVKIYDKNSQLLKESDVPSPPEVNQKFNVTIPAIILPKRGNVLVEH
ncbi:MAG TPA: hypothetical protein VHP36_00485 [Chitinispirillaceae bacterium]|nr:hypothetical protein [Chitinispirillaceae bacterium]